jgi:hypothetical protein
MKKYQIKKLTDCKARRPDFLSYCTETIQRVADIQKSTHRHVTHFVITGERKNTIRCKTTLKHMQTQVASTGNEYNKTT